MNEMGARPIYGIRLPSLSANTWDNGKYLKSFRKMEVTKQKEAHGRTGVRKRMDIPGVRIMVMHATAEKALVDMMTNPMDPM